MCSTLNRYRSPGSACNKSKDEEKRYERDFRKEGDAGRSRNRGVEEEEEEERNGGKGMQVKRERTIRQDFGRYRHITFSIISEVAAPR